MRDELKFSALVDSCLAVPPKSDKRDLTAITRLCTGFVKLLFPHAETKDDISQDEFERYCLELAKAMRQIIKKQLCVIAPQEFDVLGKREVPDIKYKE